jgi:hypothetical protein
MESFPWFLEFWHWAERRALPEKKQDLLLARIGEYWRDWFEDESAKHKTEINNLCANILAHRLFAREIKGWVEEKWPDHSQAATWLLLVLAREEPFDHWNGLIPDRQPDDGLSGFFGVYLHHAEGGGAEDVLITRCLLVPNLLPNLKPESAQPIYYADRRLLLDKQAEETPQRALGAVMNLLTGYAFWLHFLLWALFGEKEAWQRHGVMRWIDRALKWLRVTSAYRYAIDRVMKRVDQMLGWLGWFLSAALFGFLALADPWEHFVDNTVLVRIALAFVTLSLLMILARLAPILREWRHLRRQRRQWADFLRRSCACLVVGDGEKLKVIGPSFGLTLFFSILSALDRDSPAQSQLTKRLMAQLKRFSASSVFTGKIQDDGQIRSIDRLMDKIKATLACKFLKHFVTPVQREIPREGQTFQRNLPLTPGEVCAAGELSLHVQPYEEVMPLMQDIGAFRRRASSWVIVVTMVLWGCLAASAVFIVRDLVRLASAPPDPEWWARVSKVTEETCSLVLQVESHDPTRFEARIVSEYWANRSEKSFSPEQGAPSLGTVIIESEKHDEAKGSKCDAMVELIYPRHFLGRKLPPAIIETKSLRTLDNQCE